MIDLIRAMNDAIGLPLLTFFCELPTFSSALYLCRHFVYYVFARFVNGVSVRP